ncbi:hypothetical protein EVAR_36893_1 [Eumeta japonica]|uniref:Uncharacterized protein n=1 Tax=Eumeta variegata TaxID=151549 RepID=A0A4C1WT35_EUMVA|nr:hypothetical protein EVAR_36893_1 [Eumeta japonica]
MTDSGIEIDGVDDDEIGEVTAAVYRHASSSYCLVKLSFGLASRQPCSRDRNVYNYTFLSLFLNRELIQSERVGYTSGRLLTCYLARAAAGGSRGRRRTKGAGHVLARARSFCGTRSAIISHMALFSSVRGKNYVNEAVTKAERRYLVRLHFPLGPHSALPRGRS